MPTSNRSNMPSFSDRMAELAPTLSQADGNPTYYQAQSHQNLLDKIEHLGRYSSYIQVITGPQGSGKSSLFQQLVKTFNDQDALICPLTVSYETSVSDLLEQITEVLEQDRQTLAAPIVGLPALKAQLHSLHSLNRYLLLLIDNGECLDEECLDLLLNQLTDCPETDKPHIVLFAQPVLNERLKGSRRFAEAAKNHCHFTEVPPFDLLETKEFLHHSDADQAATLTDKQIEAIHHHAFGLPGHLGKATKAVLASPKSTKNKPRWGQLVAKASLSLVLIAICTGAGYTLWNLYSQPQVESSQVSISLPVPTSPETTVLPLNPAADTTAQRSPVKDEITGIDIPENAPVEVPASTLATPENPDNLVVAPIAEAKPEQELSTDIEPAPEQPVTVENPPTLTTPAGNTLVLQLKPAKVQPESPIEASPSTTEASANEQSPETPITQETAQPSMVIKADHPLLREEELLSWDTNGYTLQMLGARKETSVVDFIQSRQDKNKFYYFSTIYKEKPWYVVVYGQYQTRDEAVTAIRSLPSDLRQQKPWARSIKGVQADIRRDK